jgi:hypothetical protein
MGIIQGDLAGNGNYGGFNPVQLFAGEKQVTTNHAAVKRNQTLAKFTVVAYDTSGLLVPWAPAATDSTAVIAGVLAQPITTGATDDTQMCPFYDGGVFNFELAVFANGVTLAQVKAAQAGKTLTFEKLYG